MPRFIKRRSKKAGLAPGTLVFVGERKLEKVKVSMLDYDEEHIEEKELKDIEESYPYLEKPSVTWINVGGVHDVNVIEKMGSTLDLHPLLLEDIMNTGQRPKVDDYGDYLFIVMKMFYYDDTEDEVVSEQVSLVLCKTTVVLFQERERDVFNFVRERLRKSKGPIRKMGADYLAYALIDAVVDSYFAILERIGEEIESEEEELISKPTPETLQTMYNLKRNLAYLRKSVWPLREVVGSLERAESPLMDKRMVIYLRDVYDHTIQVMDTVETFRDMTSGMLDIYLSSVSNKMNEVMKVLTIIATVFIPLTFLAGVYGMNFVYMPELQMQWAYPVLLVVMLAVGVLMVIHFRRKGWL